MPASQIFKYEIPCSLLVNVVRKLGYIDNNVYNINLASYKKGMLDGSIPELFKECRQYYFMSKKKYVDSKINYQGFLTVLRQIGKYHNLDFDTRINYYNNAYEIIYMYKIDFIDNFVSEATVSETTVSEVTVSEVTVSETTVSETTVSEATVSERTVSETTVSEEQEETETNEEQEKEE